MLLAAPLSFCHRRAVVLAALFAPCLDAEAGLSEEQAARRPMARVFGLSLLAALVMAFNLAPSSGPRPACPSALCRFATGLGWVAMSLGVIYLFEQRSFRLWLINAATRC